MRRLILVSSASFGVLGACLTLPGALLPVLVNALDVRLMEAGSMLALQPCGYLVSVLAARRMIARWGLRTVAGGGLLVFATGIAAFGGVSSWIAGALVLLASGLGFGALEVAGNAIVVAEVGMRSTNLLNFVHLFFGVGSLLAPFAATRAVAAGLSWRVVFLLAGVATAVVALAWRWVPAPASEAIASTAGKPEHPDRRSGVRFLLATMIGVYVGVEMGIGAWLTKFLVSERGASLQVAGAALSGYWAGLALGRLALSATAHHIEDAKLLVGLSALSLAALLVAISASGVGVSATGFAVTGFGYSGIFPAIIALGGRYYPHDVPGVTGVLIAGAGIGGIVLPWTMSLIADGSSLTAGMSCYAVMTASMLLLCVAHWRGAASVA